MWKKNLNIREIKFKIIKINNIGIIKFKKKLFLNNNYNK